MGERRKALTDLAGYLMSPMNPLSANNYRANSVDRRIDEAAGGIESILDRVNEVKVTRRGFLKSAAAAGVAGALAIAGLSVSGILRYGGNGITGRDKYSEYLERYPDLTESLIKVTNDKTRTVAYVDQFMKFMGSSFDQRLVAQRVAEGSDYAIWRDATVWDFYSESPSGMIVGDMILNWQVDPTNELATGFNFEEAFKSGQEYINSKSVILRKIGEIREGRSSEKNQILRIIHKSLRMFEDSESMFSEFESISGKYTKEEMSIVESLMGILSAESKDRVRQHNKMYGKSFPSYQIPDQHSIYFRYQDSVEAIKKWNISRNPEYLSEAIRLINDNISEAKGNVRLISIRNRILSSMKSALADYEKYVGYVGPNVEGIPGYRRFVDSREALSILTIPLENQTRKSKEDFLTYEKRIQEISDSIINSEMIDIIQKDNNLYAVIRGFVLESSIGDELSYLLKETINNSFNLTKQPQDIGEISTRLVQTYFDAGRYGGSIRKVYDKIKGHVSDQTSAEELYKMIISSPEFPLNSRFYQWPYSFYLLQSLMGIISVFGRKAFIMKQYILSDPNGHSSGVFPTIFTKNGYQFTDVGGFNTGTALKPVTKLNGTLREITSPLGYGKVVVPIAIFA